MSCNHRESCGDCNIAISKLETQVEELTKMDTPSSQLPRPDRFLSLYAYGPVGGEYTWQTGQLHESEEEAIGYCLSMTAVEQIRIVRVCGLEKYDVPDTLKKMARCTGEVLTYDTESEDGQDSSD